MLETMTPDKRIILAERICDLFVAHKADAGEAWAAIRIVHDLMQPSGQAILRSAAEVEKQTLAFQKSMKATCEIDTKMRELVRDTFEKQKREAAQVESRE